MGDSAQSVYFRNCDKPVLTPVTGIVKGTVPPWLNGTLTRNGPGIQKIGKDMYKHMFDGLAVIHRFHIDNGVVTYNSRPLGSEVYHKNMAAQRIVVGEFGTIGISDPCDTLFSKFKTLFVSPDKRKDESGRLSEFTDNCAVNIAYYGDKLYALTETPYVHEIDPLTLETVGKITDITQYVALNLESAHPHVLPDGTVLNLGINFRHKKGSCYLIVQVPPSFGSKETSFKDTKIIAEIPSRWRFYPGYYHSFGMTKDKIIFIEQPYCLSIPRMMAYPIKATAPVYAYAWDPNKKTRIHVVSISNGQIHPVIYETQNLFTFHHINAYEENGQIVVDLAGYDTGEFVSKKIFVDTIKTKPSAPTGASARRYVLPLDVSNAKKGENLVTLTDCKASAVLRKEGIVDLKPEILQDRWFEFPRINYKYNGLKYRYIYGVNSSTPNEVASLPEGNILVKLDTVSGKPGIGWVGDRVWVSEPVFVPNPTVENPAEDDGLILANLLHANDERKTTLLILDAKTMKEVASVEFCAPGPVSTTFHGQWATTGDRVHLY